MKQKNIRYEKQITHWRKWSFTYQVEKMELATGAVKATRHISA